MEIFPNPALAAVLVIPFILPLVALHFILFKPLVAYLEARDAAHERARAHAAAAAAWCSSSTVGAKRSTSRTSRSRLTRPVP